MLLLTHSNTVVSKVLWMPCCLLNPTSVSPPPIYLPPTLHPYTSLHPFEIPPSPTIDCDTFAMPPHGSGSEYDSVRSNYGSSCSSLTTIGVNNNNTKEPIRSSKTASPSKPESKYVLSGQLRGVMWLLLAEFIASVMALTTRYMESLPNKTLHPMTVISWRMTISLVICLAVGYWNKTPHFPLGPKKLRPFLLLRGVGGFVGVVGFYCECPPTHPSWKAIRIRLTDCSCS